MAFNPVSVSVGNWIFFSKHLFWTAENTISGHFVEFSEIQRYNNFMNKHEKKFVNAWKKFRVAGLTRSSSSENGILDNYNWKGYFEHTEGNKQRVIFGIY